jgi:hypothetical protein
MVALSMSDVRVAHHLHTVETIYGRLNDMVSDHDTAIQQIEEEFGVMSVASDSDDDL